MSTVFGFRPTASHGATAPTQPESPSPDTGDPPPAYAAPAPLTPTLHAPCADASRTGGPAHESTPTDRPDGFDESARTTPPWTSLRSSDKSPLTPNRRSGPPPPSSPNHWNPPCQNHHQWGQLRVPFPSQLPPTATAVADTTIPTIKGNRHTGAECPVFASKASVLLHTEHSAPSGGSGATQPSMVSLRCARRGVVELGQEVIALAIDEQT